MNHPCWDDGNMTVESEPQGLAGALRRGRQSAASYGFEGA
jgi:hypothetical protein